MSVDWSFPSSNGGTEDGFNDAGIEIFTGARYDSLAREIIQNSLDAVAKGEAKVTVEFDCVNIKRADFPGADRLLEAMEKCLKECDSKKEKTFFENAVTELGKPIIQCLKIIDSGTTGLRGDYRRRKGQWYAITKARGISDKGDDPTAGGSYGIGKNAPFTVSSLRTVFYSTRYEDGDDTIFRAQGKAILMSHRIDGDEYTQATGFYGKTKRCLPIEDNIPGILRPEKTGCVVLIAGFVADSQWLKKIMSTVVSNFFYAIDQGKLEVLIQDENKHIEVIDQGSLDKYFEGIIEDSEIDIDHEKVKNAHHYYQTMKSPTSSKDAELKHIGHCKIWVRADEGLPKRVALLRKTGMLITDDQKLLKRWSGRRDFAGVFVCESKNGNSLLRDMENPQHNAFEPDRAISDRRDKCQKALTELVKWVRESVDELAKPKEVAVSQIDELAKFLPDVDSKETISGDENNRERDIEGRPKYSPKPLGRTKPALAPGETGDGDEGGADKAEGKGGKGSSDGPGEGDGTGGTGNRAPRKPVEIKNVRVVSEGAEAKKKTVHFTPMKSGDINIFFAIMGDDGGTEKISIIEDSGLQNNEISIVAEQHKRVSIQVTLAHSVSDSIVVRAFFKNTEQGGGDEIIAK